MVGDRVVLQPAACGGGEHLLQCGHSVGQRRVGVQVAADVLDGHQVGQGAGQRGVDLAPVLAQRRRDPGQAEPRVDLLLGLRHDQRAVVDPEQPVLGELESLADGDLPDPYVVLLGAGEVLQRRAPRLERHHPQVDLQPAGRAYRGLLLAAHDDLGDERQARRTPPSAVARSRRRRGCRCRRWSPASGAASRRRCTARSRRRADSAATISSAIAIAASISDRPVWPAGEARCRAAGSRAVLGPKPRSPDSRPSSIASSSAGDRGDAELLVEDHGLLRAEAGHGGQRPDPGRDLEPQLLDGRDLRRSSRNSTIFSAMDLPTLGISCSALRSSVAHVAVVPADRAGGLLVDPGLERVAAGDREQVGVLLEQGRDGLVRPGHAVSLGTRPVRVGAC